MSIRVLPLHPLLSLQPVLKTLYSFSPTSTVMLKRLCTLGCSYPGALLYDEKTWQRAYDLKREKGEDEFALDAAAAIGGGWKVLSSCQPGPRSHHSTPTTAVNSDFHLTQPVRPSDVVVAEKRGIMAGCEQGSRYSRRKPLQSSGDLHLRDSRGGLPSENFRMLESRFGVHIDLAEAHPPPSSPYLL
ncbi:hypothetical protein R3P38DRAFT_3172215 [Favolaschia claudopus]|uniref:Uncharacterized protein n=1 Tax=Favolaschia claudopus TaxID=2862362 RepID=A0AAW0DKQ2_9AGAR